MVSRYDLFFLRFSVTVFRVENTTLATVFAPILLAATAIVTVLDNVLTATMTTLIYYCFRYHLPSLSLSLDL